MDAFYGEDFIFILKIQCSFRNIACGSDRGSLHGCRASGGRSLSLWRQAPFQLFKFFADFAAAAFIAARPLAAEAYASGGMLPLNIPIFPQKYGKSL